MPFRLHSTSSQRSIGRLERLDGLRGVLAVYVMLGHTAPFIPWPPVVGRVIEAMVSHGLAGVDLFFALSGLVIVQSIGRFKGRVLPFIAARARRLLPVYFVVLAIAILALSLRSPFSVMPWVHPGDLEYEFWEAGLPHALLAHLAVHLALLQGLVPHGGLRDAQFSLLGPAWSLSTEWQFYALIAVLTLWIGTDDRGLARLVWIFLTVAVAGRVYGGAMPLSWTFHRAFLPNEAAYFAIGIAAARLWRGGGIAGFGTVLVVASLIGASHGAGWAMVGKAVPPAIWALAVAAQRVPAHRLVRPIAAVLGHPVVTWLGAVSYPLYLVNEPVGRELAVLVGTATHGDALWFAMIWAPLTLAGSIAVAAALHYTVERRFMRRSQGSGLPVAAVPAATP